MGIPLYQYDTVKSGECINCFECTVHCPRQNAKANAAPVVVSAVSTAAVFGLFYAGNLAAGQQNNSGSASTAIQQTKKGNYTDGTYTGTGQGFRGETKTSVTVENGNITDISIVSYKDDSEYFNRAKDTVISEIIENQDVDVDAVSGATFSSNGIMKSVADALGISTDTADNQTTRDSSEENSTADNQTEEAQEPQASTDNQDSTSSDTEFQDGTYTGTGTGFRGETEVSVTVENSKITDITITSYADDEQFFSRAKDTVIQEIIESQDVNVDSVSGATFSSNGIKEAVAKALGISFTNPNSEAGGERGRGREGGRH